jgi:conjugal transfer pilus assembly protein TraW
MRKVQKVPMALMLITSLICDQEQALAVDLGKRGTIFEIKEEGFVAMMIRKLKALDLDKENEKMKRIARSRVENPMPVEGIVPATRYREFYFDPTYTLQEDAVLPCGKVLHYAGTTINPLESMDLNRRLFFIDAREERQVEWLKEQLIEHLPEQRPILEDRIILIGGSVLRLKKQQNLPEIYFDQSGELTTKFGIKASPAIVEQEGKQLKIREICLGLSLNKD